MVGRLRQFVWLVWILAIFSCSDERNVSDDPTLFRLLTSDESGISFNNTLHSNGDLNIIEYLYFYNGGGVAVGDINNDGLKDVFFTGNQVENKLYLNMGNLKFQDITKEAGFVINPDWSTGVSMADINNDGYLDIYISVVSQYKNLEGHNLLYLNNGDLTFSEASEKWGLDFKGFGTHSGFFDYDRDGDLDVYLLNHAVHTTRSYTSAAGRNNFDALAGDRLLENQLSEGSNFFIDISESAGIFSSPQGYGLGLVISDINQDGWPDIYVGNDFHEDDYLYINQMDGTFKESLAGYFNHTSRFTMGVDIADVNGDLTSDVFSLDMLPADNQILMKSGGEESDKVAEIKMGFGYKNQYARNAFQLNNRNQYFSDISLLTNTYASDWSWSVLLQDYDNDGKTDIFITNGIYKRPNDLDYINFLSNINLSNINLSREEQDSLERVLIETMPSLKIPNYMYRNLGELNFKEISEEWGLDIPSYSSGAVYSDLDNDGDLDLVVNNVNSDAFLFENLTDSLRLSHYLKVNLAGKLNKFGVGADVYLYARDKIWRREEFGTRGFQSSSASILHFGLGEVSQVDSLVIYWPDGTMQTHGPVGVDKTLNIVQNSKPYSKQLDKENQTVQYLDFRHIENQFNDYDNEPLILEKLSTEGPALGTADFNSDGLKDFYVGGARGQSGAIYYQLRDGGFSKFVSESFQKDELFEDIDVGILDVENDGDMDIYVVSGGGDMVENSPLLMDRIYLNENGDFKRMDAHLPATNGATVAVCDFDRNGFSDIFVGSRSVPGTYGIDPESFLIENIEGESFKIKNKLPLGMVTDAVFVDIDNNSGEELLLCGDWMGIKIYELNSEGKLLDVSNQKGLDGTNGFWNVIHPIDLNGDGLLDILAGNQGLNSKLKASAEHPLRIYLDDFDGNGQLDPIVFYWKNDVNIPFASKEMLVSQLPSLKKQFLSYNEFSKVNSIEVLTNRKVENIYAIKEITELRSGVFMNSGGVFEFIPFPHKAQFSPIQSFEVLDMNSDLLKDVIYVGNFFGSVNAVGKFDSSPGGILLNQKGSLAASGLSVPLPFDNEYREIRKISNNKLIVMPNNANVMVWEVSIK